MLATEDILGRASVIDVPCMVKGNMVRTRRRYVTENYGTQAVDALAQKLSGASLRYLNDPPPAAAWVPFAPLFEVDAAIVRGPFAHDIGLMRNFGATIAGYDLKTIYKIFFKVASPTFVMSRTHLIWRMYFNMGSFSAADISSTHAHLLLEGGGQPRYMCRYGIAGFLENSVSLSGGVGVRSTHVSCIHDGAPRCGWLIEWKG